MPTSPWGLAFYIFALFPGVAFLFAREGHTPVSRRSALRETATVVLVSTICDSVVFLVVAIASTFLPDLRSVVTSLLKRDFTWVIENYLLATIVGSLALLVATLLGLFLGSKRAHELGLKRFWDSEIARDVSAWERVLHPLEAVEVRVGLNLKSGAWISGTLYHFDNDPDSNPNRAMTLNREIRVRAPGAAKAEILADTDWVIISAGDIETIQAAYYSVPDSVLTSGKDSKSRRKAWGKVGWRIALVGGLGLMTLSSVARWQEISQQSGGLTAGEIGLASATILVLVASQFWRARKAK